MFKGRLNRGERSTAHNRGATYISATHLASFDARFMWENPTMQNSGIRGEKQCFHVHFDDIYHFLFGFDTTTSRLIMQAFQH